MKVQNDGFFYVDSVTSITRQSLPLFQGYAFSDADFILGQEGLNALIRAGGTFRQDTDGCYLFMHRDAGGSLCFDTDYRGYFSLFYYQRGDKWAVSSSLPEIAKRVRAHGWPLSVREHQLDAWNNNRALCLQLSSERTVFNEVKCILPQERLRVDHMNQLHVDNKPRVIEASSYSDAIAKLIRTWSSRIATLLKSNMAIRLDLSGGVDSRVILAIFLRTLRNMDAWDLLTTDKVLINSAPKMKEDFVVAQQIAAAKQLLLNNPERRRYPAITSEQGYESWWHFNLGRYSPNVMPVAHQNCEVVTLPGVGGEEHRPFYETFGKGGLVSYMFAFEPLFPSLSKHALWIEDAIESTDKTSSAIENFQMGLSVRHYRAFRGRHHSSKLPVNEIMGAIFGSKAFYDCTYFAAPEAMNRNQILFDVMYACDRDLPFMTYDKADKFPSVETIANLLDSKLELGATSGSVFRGAAESCATSVQQNAVRPNEVLVSEVCDALSRQNGQGNVSADTRTQAEQVMSQMRKNGMEKNYHAAAASLHYVLLADLCYS